VDHHHSPTSDFKIGEQVFVRAEYINATQPSEKLSEKYLSPFDIITRPGTHSVTIHLPDHLCAIHLVFHVSQLELATPNQILNCTQPPPPPVEINNELKYEILEILNSKIDNQRRCKLLYFVCWAGYEGTDEETSWLPAPNLTMHKNSLYISILITPENQDLYKIKLTFTYHSKQLH